MSVLISGASGYIAKHIVRVLLEQNYKVIGTVRSQDKADKLLKQYNNPNLSYEIVPEIANLDAFDDIFKKHGKEIKYVIHAASPVNFGAKDLEKDLVIPAINGTKNMFEAIKKYAPDTVERVVMTASYASIMTPHRQNDPTLTLDEETWNPVTEENAYENVFTAYCASKTFAEKEAWKFVKENSDAVKFKLTTIHPSFVFGPQNFDEDVTKKLNVSCEIINGLLHAPFDTKVEKTHFSQFIDVRDVAKTHVLGFQKDELINQRLLLCNGAFSQQDIVNVFNEDFPELKGQFPPEDKDTDLNKGVTGCKIDNEKTKKLLAFEFTPFHKTIHDTVYQILHKEGRV
uniref:Uncharacterized protein ADH n=1 Tax=Vanderwaltozyma polyspora (strain ATCC 22028 / DSM 70294 / BCRC 21397 / CBS 2163 / NBRC 10782 / NRRL Y-8283 / UCD 57-17) TaxID=436907 RepID=UPI000F84E825|nr:Chain A, Uncharacterized protein ADH [Vanderwaltozyma polyspora DSM 70294]5ZED_B Chain B, Uncharacterized protein ADH [Vanderwaltozyma polyspora DSM 70294]